jgi:hypothetical protein
MKIRINKNGDRRLRWSPLCQPGEGLVGRGGVEPPTFRFSGGRSYRLSYLPMAFGISYLPNKRDAARRLTHGDGACGPDGT